MRFRPAIELAVLAGVLAATLAWPLRSPPIDHHGEAREGLVVQGIVDRGEWVLPRRNAELPSKPPLFHWIAAAGALAFGLSDATLRLPSALAAFAVAACTLVLGRALGGRTVGWLAVGGLLGMVPFLACAVEARVDALFTAAITAALVAFLLWYRTRSARARAGLYLGIAAAVLAKGPAGAVLPALVIGIFLAVEGEWCLLPRLWSWPLAALVLLVDGGWYVLAARAGGRDFVALQLWRENWSRFVGSPEFRRHARSHTLRLPVLLATQFLPWTLVLPWTLRQRRRGVRSDPAERFLHIWWMVVLCVFSIGAGKRPVYLLPAAPALALLAARALAAWATEPPHAGAEAIAGRWGTRLAQLALLVVAYDVSVVGVQLLVRQLKDRRPSLIRFADEVSRIAPGRDPVPVESEVHWTRRMVLAYRLRRPVPFQHGEPEAGTVYVVAASRRLARWCRGDVLLADSGATENDFALMRRAADPAPVRSSRLCRDAPDPAIDGALGVPTPQESARSETGLLLPLGE